MFGQLWKLENLNIISLGPLRKAVLHSTGRPSLLIDNFIFYLPFRILTEIINLMQNFFTRPRRTKRIKERRLEQENKAKALKKNN